MLVDKLRVDFMAGKGGDGCVSFAKYGRSMGKNGNLYYPQRGKPDGGIGGKGGDIYLEGSSNVYDLSGFTAKGSIVAEDGNIGQKNTKKGKNGKDIVILVPLVTIVTDINGKPVISIKRHGDRKLLVKGGDGGLGNYTFREGQVPTLNKFTKGTNGTSLKAFVELRLQADVIFIGFPNVGKSSLLNLLTNANVKVASYPFTTIQPQLGVIPGSEHIKLMDLPGLIEGVAQGKGLGRSFNKHTVYAKLMAHFITLESEDLEKDYLSIREELKDFSENLSEKPEIIVITKSDLYLPEEIEEKIQPLKKYKKEIYVISNLDSDSTEKVKDKFKTAIYD